VGLLHEATDHWTSSLVLLLVLVVVQIAVGVAAGRSRLVGANA
jgi:CP family cyanate transporter-like MFS transporter